MRWNNDRLMLLDQTKLPGEITYMTCIHWQEVRDAISILAVRGAPAIGVAAAYGMVLAAKELLYRNTGSSTSEFVDRLYAVSTEIDIARPTAVNLHWALKRMMTAARSAVDTADTGQQIVDVLEKLAVSMQKEDIAVNRAISSFGASELAKSNKPLTILTHCNAGALATTGIGTALGVIRALHQKHLIKMVYADETRPLLQGARLTVTELMSDDIPVTLITDNMAAWVMKTKKVDAVVVGADRIAHNGDTANKIGTYGVSILSKAHHIPFYVAAPTSTFDLNLSTGDAIPIEERSHDEVRRIQNIPIALPDSKVFNPAFDVTPHENITAIVTELGVVRHPDTGTLTHFFNQKEVL